MELRGSHIFSVRFDDEVVRDAVRVFVIERTMREQKGKWAAAGLVVVAGFVLLFQANFTLALLAFLVACFPAIFSAVVWRAHSASAFGRYRRMTDRSAEVTIDPEGFGIVSNLGDGRLNWPNVTEIWERPLSFMLFSGTSAFNILPRKAMPQEVQAFLSAKAI
ncbi:YcxB family protein [Neorhizobium galegae]|uniref:YcxB family protein n=1 Tax=Neorhizobium galegae TaxID=399 RepID=UPI002101F9DF|nr:YcxB family protein [Neorhizobium galegae]MCQ1849767.1 YcxB family protein [Neorhizobium galegae]